MIETTSTHIWVLVLFTIVTGADGSRVPVNGPLSFHTTLEACTAAGQHIVARMDVAPGGSAHFACVPRGTPTDMPNENGAMVQPR